MGRLAIDDMLNHASVDQALSWHLSANHYPPIPSIMFDACKAAIEAGNEGDFDREVELPDGVAFRGQSTAPACELIEYAHLDSFIDYVEEPWPY